MISTSTRTSGLPRPATMTPVCGGRLTVPGVSLEASDARGAVRWEVGRAAPSALFFLLLFLPSVFHRPHVVGRVQIDPLDVLFHRGRHDDIEQQSPWCILHDLL